MPAPPDRWYTSPDAYQQMMHWYDRTLAALRVPVRTRWVPTDYGATHLIEAGNVQGPTVAFVHGINVSALGWRRQIEAVAPHYRVVAPDLPGMSGRSDAGRIPYVGDAYAHWLRQVFDAADVERALLVGSSGGGYTVLKLASVYPERAAGLLLINPCGVARYPYPLDLFRNRHVVHLVGVFGRRFLASRRHAERLVRASASPGVTIDPVTVDMAYILLAHFKRYPPPGPLPAAELKRIQAPTLLLMSQHEPYFSARMVIRRAAQTLHDLQHEIITDAGHDIHHDQPAAVTGRLLRFAGAWFRQPTQAVRPLGG